MSRRGRIGTDPGLLDALIAAKQAELEVLIAQRAVVTVERLPKVPHGQLRNYVLQLLGLSVLPMSPDVLQRLVAAHGYGVSRQTVAAILTNLRRKGLAVSLGHGKWRRADRHQQEWGGDGH